MKQRRNRVIIECPYSLQETIETPGKSGVQCHIKLSPEVNKDTTCLGLLIQIYTELNK